MAFSDDNNTSRSSRSSRRESERLPGRGGERGSYRSSARSSSRSAERGARGADRGASHAAAHASRRTVNAAQSRKTSEQIRSNTYGTHHGASNGAVPGSAHRAASGVVPHVENMSRHSGNAAAANISSRRQAKRANRGYVDQITPTTMSGESVGANSRRMNRRNFGQEIQRKSSMKRAGFILVALLLIAGIGAAAAHFAFFASVDARLAAGSDDGLSASLTAQEQGQPFYTLLAADLNDINGNNNIDAMLLARFDQSTKQITLVAIPGNLKVATGDSQVSLSSVLASAGASSAVNAVSSLTGVKISHYLHIDKAGFVKIVDDLGGVSVSVKEVVDDPQAGSIYLSVGEQTLDGASAAVYLAAANYKKGVETQMACQLEFAQAFATRFFADDGGFVLDGKLDDLASHLVTDMSARELQYFLDELQGTNGSAIYVAQIEGSEQSSTAHGYTAKLFYPTASSVANLMAKVDEGSDPSVLTQQSQASSVDKESFEITVRNGSGMTGGATSLAQILTDAGFTVAETGNADSYVYTETLVIYLDPAYKEACEAVVQALGTGRVVNGINGYTFDTEVLVVLGSDWKPLS